MTTALSDRKSGHKQNGPRGKMCRESNQRSITNFPPIEETNRFYTSPGCQRRGSNNHLITGASRPRSNSDYSLGDVWSSGRRSICSSNGRSSMSFSSDASSTVASTEKLWRRRKLSPRRVASRPVTPFPAEDTLPSSNGEAARTPFPPHDKSAPKTQPHAQARRRKNATFSLAQKLPQPIAEEQITGKIPSNKARRKAEDCSESKPQTALQRKESEASKTSERRRRKSLPDMNQRQKGEARKTDIEGKKTETRGFPDTMDRVARDRIMNWLAEVAHAKVDEHDNSLQEALSSIDEE